MDPVWKQAGEQESSDPLLANASQPIRVGSGMFTGYIDIYINRQGKKQSEVKRALRRTCSKTTNKNSIAKESFSVN